MTPEQKSQLLKDAKEHYAADMLIKEMYVDIDAEEFRGCSVGCFLHSVYPEKTLDELNGIEDKHSAVAEYYGYPVWLAHLQDRVFEGLPIGEHAKWHVQLAETLHHLPEDYDWQKALHRVHVAILRILYRTAGEAQEVVQRVLDLHQRAANGEAVSADDWSAAESMARSEAYQEIRDGVILALVECVAAESDHVLAKATGVQL